MMAQRVEGSTDVFERGDIHWKQFNVNKWSASSPPKPLQIFTPTVPGSYPVIVFCHGFCTRNTFYCQLLAHIVSHGFILVAPQLFCIRLPICIGLPLLGPCEVNMATKVVDWLAKGLQPLLPEKVEANMEKVVLSGHSKGGKTAFAVALDKQTSLKISALIGIDPVAGSSKNCETCPRILTHVPQSFNLNMPVAVIGTGLGPDKGSWWTPACAPDGMNHKEFFDECKPPRAHFVVSNFGHMDMLDDETGGVCGTCLSKCICKKGSDPRELMRRTIGGLVVAFLRAHLNGHFEDFYSVLRDPGLAPTTLDQVAYFPA
ncbi:hypothetical protein Fmac_030133 [Flemingia macrophylla]|uniref:Chlorophyllase n=1 Tax=Flemingia macrophylla TaxID=520843 RepID=A0ABD1LCA4_9FABA